MRVKITKLSAVANPHYPTADAASFRYGEDNGAVSLPVDYWLVGELATPIEVGRSVHVHRESRNGVDCPGEFLTSTVQTWDGTFFTTMNSRYKVERML